MITIEAVVRAVPGLTEVQLRSWMEQEWVRPDLLRGEPRFHDIDLARIRLIAELHTELEVEAPTLPLVLSLLDQLYATRQQLRIVLDSVEPATRSRLADALASVR